MLNHVHVMELLPAYALDSLDEEEAIQVAEHLDACPGCRAELLSYQTVADRLALAAPDAAPPHSLKQQILGQLANATLGANHHTSPVVVATYRGPVPAGSTCLGPGQSGPGHAACAQQSVVVAANQPGRTAGHPRRYAGRRYGRYRCRAGCGGDAGH